MDFSEKWGTSIDEAVRLALADLNLTKDDVTVTVLEEPARGFFGIGQKLAKVRVEKKIIKEVPKTETPKSEKQKPVVVEPKREAVVSQQREKVYPVKIEEKAEKAGKREDRNPERRDRSEKPAKERSEARGANKLSLRVRPSNLQEVKEHAALTFLTEVTEKMGLSLSLNCFVDEENVFIDIEGKDSGTIIGKRGQTLDAVQYLTSLVVNKDSEKYIRVVIDAENYRTKRERTLEQLAIRLADKVRRTGKSVRLEPMNPYERKVIHATLQGRSEVTTRSEGEEPYRRVIIEKK